MAILENAREQTARLQVVERDQLFAVEPGLLDEARGLMGRLPFDQLDLLVIGEIGKNYSGAGIDPNVVGRLLIEAAPDLEFDKPRITRICVLDLSPESHGNGTGVGIADLTTERLLAVDRPGAVPHEQPDGLLPVAVEAAVRVSRPTASASKAGVATCWQPDLAKLRMAVIPNTLEVAEMWVSPPLAEEAKSRPHLRIDRRREATAVRFRRHIGSAGCSAQRLRPRSLLLSRLCRAWGLLKIRPRPQPLSA